MLWRYIVTAQSGQIPNSPLCMESSWAGGCDMHVCYARRAILAHGINTAEECTELLEAASGAGVIFTLHTSMYVCTISNDPFIIMSMLTSTDAWISALASTISN